MARAGFHQNRPVIEIADILRRHGEAYRARPRRASRARRAARDERDHRVPDDGARRSRRGLRRLRRHADRLQLLPQSPLSEVPGRGAGEVARRPPSRTLAGSLFPPRLHLARADRRDRLPEQGRRLRDPVQGSRRRHDDARRQSAQARRQDRRPRGSSHLGPDLDPSPARPLRRAGRRALVRRDALDRGAAELLSRRQTALPTVPPPVSRTPAGGFRVRRSWDSSTS